MTKNIGININERPRPSRRTLFPETFNPILRNVATSDSLMYSSQLHEPSRIAALEKVEINDDAITISLYMEDEKNTSLRVVAVNSLIFHDLNYEELDESQQAVFFPLARRGYNFNYREFPEVVRSTDLIVASGHTKIKFDNFVANEDLSLFFIFYNEGRYQIYRQDIIIGGEILKPAWVVDKTYFKKRREEFLFQPSVSNMKFLQDKQDKVLFSKIHYTPDSLGNIRFVFGFDIKRYLENNVAFPELISFIDDMDALVDYKCLRYWIGDDKSFSVFDSKFPKTLNLQVVEDIDLLDDVILFSGVDDSAERGNYSYHVNLIIMDPTIDEAEERVRLLKKYRYELLHYEDLTDAADLTLGKIIFLYPQRFLFLKERIDSASVLSKEITMRVVATINEIIDNIQFRLRSIKGSSDLNYKTGGGETVVEPKLSLNSVERARRATTLYKTYLNIGLHDSKELNIMFDQFTPNTLNSLSFEQLAQYVSIVEENVITSSINMSPPVSGIKTFTESRNEYADYKTGSFYVGSSMEQLWDKKESSQYVIEKPYESTVYKLKYLASYLSSDIDGSLSIHCEDWVEINGAQEALQLKFLGNLLVKVESQENINNKYFFVRAV
tara:strand:+ start:3319 stop:5151 length:1833 start_codon:yes stop_codon:yes gene_type:complete